MNLLAAHSAPGGHRLSAGSFSGQATLAAGACAPRIVMIAEGAASGSFTADTEGSVLIPGNPGASNGRCSRCWPPLPAS